MVTASAQIAAFAVGSNKVDFTPAQRHQAYRALLDTYAVAIAGRNEDAPGVLRGYLDEVAGIGQATAWDTGRRMPAESAALLNGTLGHVLDYDDMLEPMVGHPSVAMIPALVAVSQVCGADGRQFSSAYLTGFEVLAKLSSVMAMQHCIKGWQSTAALAVLGATAACSVLLKLDEQQTINALGLAVTHACGNRENFGTMAKSLQVGQCNASAVRAVLLAKRGFVAPEKAIDGKYGFTALYGLNEDLGPELSKLGKGTLEIDAPGIDIKKYPCCYGNHRTVDAVLALRKEHGLKLQDVASVEAVVQKRGLQPLTYPRPKTGLEAKFSLEYNIAAPLLDGHLRLRSYDEGEVNRAAIQEFLPNITKREAEGEMLPRWTDVKFALKNGKSVKKHVSISHGDAGDPLTDAELTAKVEDCFSYAGFAWNAREFSGKVLDMASMKVADVVSSPLKAAA